MKYYLGTYTTSKARKFLKQPFMTLDHPWATPCPTTHNKTWRTWKRKI